MGVLVALCCCVFSSAIASSHECHWYSPLQLYWCWRDLICVFLYSKRQDDGEHVIYFKLRSKLPFSICVTVEVVDLLCQDYEIELDSALPSSYMTSKVKQHLMAISYIQSTSPSLSPEDCGILVIWVFNIYVNSSSPSSSMPSSNHRMGMSVSLIELSASNASIFFTLMLIWILAWKVSHH